MASHSNSRFSTFTINGVAVSIAPHHCDCFLWPCSELWIHAGERGKEKVEIRNKRCREGRWAGVKKEGKSEGRGVPGIFSQELHC